MFDTLRTDQQCQCVVGRKDRGAIRKIILTVNVKVQYFVTSNYVVKIRKYGSP